MGIRWFSLDDFYETDGDACIFYPSLYARGYPFTSEDRASMDGVLGPFLSRRLRTEFVALFCLVTSALVGASITFLVGASTEELDAILAMPAGLWIFFAVVLAGVILLPILFRLWLRIKNQLDQMDLYASEPPRPDFFVVEGEFSLTRLSYVLFALGAILVVVGIWAG
jgi:hypothetical protein